MESDAQGWDLEYDFVVLGAGAGGMTAALVGAIEGARTLVIERTGRVGGTTARSSGTVWIPDNPQQRSEGITGDARAAGEYLDALVDGRAERALREAFIAAGPRMIDYLGGHTDLRFRMYAHAPDYRQELPGAAQGGRPLEPMPFDGRTLGPAFDRLGWPLPELMLFGGMMVTRGEAAQLLRAGRSWEGFLLGARLVSRYAADRLRYARGTRLVLGNALAGRLLRNLLDRGVPVWFDAKTLRLETEAGAVTGLLVEQGGATKRIRARRGVVMAGGGFPASAQMRARHLPQPTPEYTPAYEGCTGATLELAQAAGAALGRPGEDNALWFPSSVARRADGSTAVYPHIVLDRAKPGLIAVNSAGRRFVDEAVSYHEFTRAMYRAHRSVPGIPAWLVCDRRFLWKYGLGMIRPLTLADRSLRAARLSAPCRVGATGWRARSASIPTGSRRRCAGTTSTRVPAWIRTSGRAAIRTTWATAILRTGRTHASGRSSGRRSSRWRCCRHRWAPASGLSTDANARVVDGRGEAIAGLYACGNDMHSVMGGEYPGAGSQLGLAMTFGYLAALDAVGRG